MKQLKKSQDSIMHNTKQKDYPNGMHKITIASRKVYREKGWEAVNPPSYVKIPKPQRTNPITRSDSLHRSKTAIYDIIQMNRDTFKYFVTLTFDPKIINSNSSAEVIKVLRSFLKNAVNRQGLSYILIPEYHKKGGKIHMHGYFSEGMALVDSGTLKAAGYDKPMFPETLKRKGIPLESCKTAYNMPQWKYGFSTVFEIDGNGDTLFGYVTKYITKDLSKIFGNTYYAGGKLERHVPYKLYDTDYDSFTDYDNIVYCEAIQTSFKYAKITDN